MGEAIQTKPSRQALYQRMAAEVSDLTARFGGLPTSAQAADVWADLWHRDTHHSTAIEGNTLALLEVERLLENERTTSKKPLSEYIEVRGYADAARWVYDQAMSPDERHSNGDLLTLQEVRHVHYLTLTPLWTISPHPHDDGSETPGNFRRHQIAEFPGGMKPPSWTDVDHLMREWVDDVCRLETEDAKRFVEGLAGLHHSFEQIHPFLDGNGRTGRLLLNLLLIRHDHPPAVIEKSQRDRYLTALKNADGGNIGPLAELITRAVLDSLNRFALTAMASDSDLLPLAALVDENSTENALRVAAHRGRLRAVKGRDGGWLSTRGWLDEYRVSRYRRYQSS